MRQLTLTDIVKREGNLLVRFISIGLFVYLFFALMKHFQAEVFVLQMFDWIKSLGPLAPVLFILIYIPTAGIIVPSIILKIVAGSLFNVAGGFIIISIAATISSIMIFLGTRYYFRAMITRRLKYNPRFRLINEVISKDGWKIVVLLRNVPIVSSVLINCACALSKMSLKDFITSTWVGRIPSTILYAYLGFLTGYTISSGNLSPHSSAGSITLVVGLVAMIILTEYVVRLSKKTLQENYSL